MQTTTKMDAVLAVALSAGFALSAYAQQKTMSIGTGGTGGVYYPLGGAVANVLSNNLPNVQATAEVTGGSVDNLKLVGSGKPYIGFVMADAAQDAVKGEDKFKSGAIPVRTLMVLYPNRMHVVTVDGTGITKMADLKGKRVSTGSPGSDRYISMVVSSSNAASDSIRAPPALSLRTWALYLRKWT